MGIKVRGRNITNLTYADDTALLADNITNLTYADDTALLAETSQISHMLTTQHF
jgi:hypothetical protein